MSGVPEQHTLWLSTSDCDERLTRQDDGKTQEQDMR